jgi:hypothetical protein
MTGDVRTAIPIAAKITFRLVLIVDLPFAACGVPGAGTIAANIVAAELMRNKARLGLAGSTISRCHSGLPSLHLADAVEKVLD